MSEQHQGKLAFPGKRSIIPAQLPGCTDFLVSRVGQRNPMGLIAVQRSPAPLNRVTMRLPMNDKAIKLDSSVASAQRIDQLCDAFESEWISGQPPRLEPALAKAGPNEQDHLLRELLSIDIFYRVKNGEEPSSADYAARSRRSIRLGWTA